MQVIIYDFVLVYAKIRSFIVTCLLCSCPTNQYQHFRNVSHPSLKQLVIKEFLLEDLAKTQYTRDDKGPYFNINVDQHSFRTTSSIGYMWLR